MSKTFYRHWRPVTHFDVSSQKMQNSTHGGITARMDEKEDGSGYHVSFSIVGKRDRYCRNTGRRLTDARAVNNADDWTLEVSMPGENEDLFTMTMAAAKVKAEQSPFVVRERNGVKKKFDSPCVLLLNHMEGILNSNFQAACVSEQASSMFQQIANMVNLDPASAGEMAEGYGGLDKGDSQSKEQTTL